MDCKKFLEILDQDRDGGSSASDRSDFDLHIERCPSCRSAVQVVDKVRKAYSGQLPDERKTGEFQQRLFARIDRLGKEASPPSYGKPLIGLIGVGALLGLLGLVLWSFTARTSPVGEPSPHAPPAAPSAPASPSLSVPVPLPMPLARITVDGKTISVNGDSRENITSSRDCRIAFASGEVVEIRGESQFKPESHGMELFRGQASYTFHAVQGAFRVKMPQAVLAIRGTVLRIHNTPGEDLVWVDEGAISWEHGSSKKSGLLEKGAGLRFRSDKVEPWTPVPSVPKPFIPLDTDPVASVTALASSQAGFVASSVITEPPTIKGTDDGF